jgi:DNA-binding MarR family transcriptional regulator
VYLCILSCDEICLKELGKKLDQVIALLKILARKEIESSKRSILSTQKKEQILDLCDGSTEMSEIAKKADVSGEYVRLTIKELEDAGFVVVKRVGVKRYPFRMI